MSVKRERQTDKGWYKYLQAPAPAHKTQTIKVDHFFLTSKLILSVPQRIIYAGVVHAYDSFITVV